MSARSSMLFTALITLGITLAVSGCNRQKTTAPERQTTTGVQPRDQPVVATGCLRPGDASDTFVLMSTDKTGSGADTATYQLIGPAALNLSTYVGKRVQVSGTLRAEQAVASDSGATREKATAGTSGTPTVETRTTVDIRQMTVESVQSVGGDCDVKHP